MHPYPIVLFRRCNPAFHRGIPPRPGRIISPSFSTILASCNGAYRTNCPSPTNWSPVANDVVLFLGAAVPVCSQVLLDRFDGDTEKSLSQGPLVYDEDLRMWSLWLERAGLDRSADALNSGMLVEGSDMLRFAARASCGVALCRTAFLRADLQENLLVQISDIAIDEDWCYFMRCSNSSRSVPGVPELLAYLKSCAE